MLHRSKGIENVSTSKEKKKISVEPFRTSIERVQASLSRLRLSDISLTTAPTLLLPHQSKTARYGTMEPARPGRPRLRARQSSQLDAGPGSTCQTVRRALSLAPHPGTAVRSDLSPARGSGPSLRGLAQSQTRLVQITAGAATAIEA